MIWFVTAGLGILLFIWLVTHVLASRDYALTNLSDKYVLITGSGSGLGFEATIRLDRLGFNVFAACRRKESVDDLRRVCSERVHTFLMDVTDTENIQRVFREIQQCLPKKQGLWGLINNAGVLKVGPLDWQPLTSFKRTADVNLWGLIDVTKTFLPLIKKAKGRIVNMGSSCGQMALPYLGSYCITKYGVRAFNDALRREMQPFGVHVIHIEAGAHRTKLLSGQLLSQQWRELWGELDEQKQKEYGESSLTQGAEEMLRFDTITSSHTSTVTDTIVKALTGAVPKPNYVVGLDAKAIVIATLLPTCLVDWLMKLAIKPLTTPTQR